jgi:hypothetical protein
MAKVTELALVKKCRSEEFVKVGKRFSSLGV